MEPVLEPIPPPTPPAEAAGYMEELKKEITRLRHSMSDMHESLGVVRKSMVALEHSHSDLASKIHGRPPPVHGHVHGHACGA